MPVEDQYCSIPIELVLKYTNDIPFDIYLRLSEGKIVKISHAEEDFRETFLKYKDKGIEHVYAKKEEYVHFLEKIKDGLKFKFFDTESTPAEQVQLLDKSYEVLKKSFGMLGVNEVSLEMAQEIASKSIKLIHSQPNVAKFFKDFKDSCKREFMKNMLVSYMVSCMLDTFSWSSPAMKEKSAMAVMLRDILLDSKDFEEIEQFDRNPKNLSEKVFNHPKATATLLNDEKRKNIPHEVITIIEQHHEEPDGTGFPLGLMHQRVTPLSAIIVVADRFINEMIQQKFDIGKKDDIINRLSTRYPMGSFHKAVQSIDKLFG